MEELFNNMIANAWDVGLSEVYENPLSYEMIEDSVGRACDFFHIEHPESIELGHTTAVSLGDTGTYGDEILFFNRLQLEDMGITGQDGLDLVMTHEGTHRVLQDMNTGFDIYQEELCCDYMAGVRAGLNGMDVSQLENSLIDLPQGLEHPIGALRVEAIEQGMAFAHEYMEHYSKPPTFNEYLDEFNGGYMHDVAELARLGNEVYACECTMEHYHRMFEHDPENELAQHHFEESKARYEWALQEYEAKRSMVENGVDTATPEQGHKPSFKGKWTKAEIESHKHDAERRMNEQKSYEKSAREEIARRAKAGLPTDLAEHQLNEAISKYKTAKNDYNSWCNEKPKDK